MISYGDSMLSKAEKNYTITELQLLALMDGCLRFLIYLHDKPFTVYTDHANLQSPRATRWALKLSAFKMIIVLKPGKHKTAPFPTRSFSIYNR